MTRDDERRSALEAILDAFNAHDLDRIMSFFVEDCVLEMPRGPDPWGARSQGKDAVRSAFGARFAGIPDVHSGNAEHFVSGDTGLSRWTLKGTGVDGVALNVDGCDFILFAAPRCRRKTRFGSCEPSKAALTPVGNLAKYVGPLAEPRERGLLHRSRHCRGLG